ncbi:CTD small phosphatase-like protein [Drosera capensis]
MQTKKKISARTRTVSSEPTSPRISRSQKKLSQNGHVGAKESAVLITSSVRKQKLGGTPAKTNSESYVNGFNSICSMVMDETMDAAQVYHEECVEATAEQDTIFSPSFHASKTTGADSVNGEISGACLSSDVSAIYLAMKNSKLKCLDEHGPDSMPDDVCMDEDDYEEFDDFDPYAFIRNLPELSSVVPTFRPLLLPKQTRRCPRTTLVLDLDETLVHSTLEPCPNADFTFKVNFNQKEHTVYVRCRPHLRNFMERVANLFEIIIFTASQSIYAEQLLNVLDPKRKVFRHRVFRESCVYVEGNYLKDLSVLGRDLARVIIVDNSPQAFGFQVDNGIPIESWFDDRMDKELLLLIPFLEILAGVEDVRPLIAQKFNLRKRIAAAVYPS